MNDIFFTSDQHYGHKAILRLGQGRPFSSVEEMNETLIERHNAVVKNGDRVYHLGDIFFKATVAEAEGIISRLKGQHYLVLGNHDEVAEELQKKFAPHVQPFIWQKDIAWLTVGQRKLMLCHYPMRSWKKKDGGSWHLFGHVHGRLPRFGNSFDVGVDAYNFTPVSFNEVAQRMEKWEPNSEIGSVADGRPPDSKSEL